MAIEQRVLDRIALSRSEYELIVSRLGREPSEVELGMFGALWSEHCSYKNSRSLLAMLPSTGECVLTKLGGENAGAVDLGDGLCAVLKIESHNHPSAIEPYEGAATGVGGIVRDIFAMGARPIALLDSLRFGPLRIPKSRYLFTNVVSGIGGYGNCLGIPTVGGEVAFEEGYTANPLVNAMCVGVAKSGGLVSALAAGAGNLLMLVGADTGRDGIHGASGLASRSDPHARFDELRPAVQVGNPFLEKILMEGCIDLAQNHREWIVGIQDLGAAGLTSACVEAASRGASGVIIDVEKVSRREEGMTPYEVMLSESQERMLFIVRQGCEAEVVALCERWELPCSVIGRVTDDGLARICDGEREVASAPIQLLTGAPAYTQDAYRPEGLDQLQALDAEDLPDLRPGEVETALLRLMGDANIASRRWVHRQYDQSVLNNTVVGAGGDAAVLRIPGTSKGIALATDGNGRYCYLDPYAGGAIAIAEALRNIVCTGATPLAVTDCLNFGNPERPEVYWQMREVMRGMAAACRALSVPVVSGNVSLYNETAGRGIYPTPVIGALGLLDEVGKRITLAPDDGDELFILGGSLEGVAISLGGSRYLEVAHGLFAGRPSIDLGAEARSQGVVLAAASAGLISAAHDCSDGGLAVALAEMAVAAGCGVDATAIEARGRLDALLFGESQGRILLAVRPGAGKELASIAGEKGVVLMPLGRVGGDRFRLGRFCDVAIADLAGAYDGGLERALMAEAD